MPGTPTPNLGLTAPLGSDPVSAGATNFQSISNTLDAGVSGPVVTRVQFGTLAQLPDPTVQPLGTLYHATDANIMLLRNSSSGWTYIPAGQSVSPIGAIVQYGGTIDPVDPDGTTRWLICDGRSLVRASFTALFTALGVTYGNADGSHFNIPNGQGNVLVGKSGSLALGTTGGERNHTLSSTEMAVHTHTDAGHGHTDSGHSHGVTTNAVAAPTPSGATNSGGGLNVAGTSSGGFTINSGAANIQSSAAALQNTGGGTSHNNMQPYVVMNHIIRVL